MSILKLHAYDIEKPSSYPQDSIFSYLTL